MIRLRYNLVRWVIAILTLVLVVLTIMLRPSGGDLILLVLLLMASSGAIVYPPGLYFWLLRAVCPDCQGRVEWAIEQGSVNPYVEQLVIRCSHCDKKRVEFSFDPT